MVCTHFRKFTILTQKLRNYRNNNHYNSYFFYINIIVNFQQFFSVQIVRENGSKARENRAQNWIDLPVEYVNCCTV